ncbi:MAG: Acyl dehydratase [Chloroflexi bacterium]|nr:MAG: Acyl dehydratase [Chloroflexota bacterium]
MPDAGMITTLDEFEEEYRKGIGQPLPNRWTIEASADNIRRWGDGVGDYNPLWRDPAYAAAGPYQRLTAPPTFIYACSLGVRAAEDGAIDPDRLSTTNFPMNYAGGEIVFHRPIWLGDVITAQEEVGPIIRKHSERIGPFVINTGLVQYINQRQELVASKATRMARYQNLGSGSTIEYDRETRDDRQSGPADPLVWERERRGPDPLYWQDLSAGDKLPILPKGTYSVSELFLFTHGVLGTYRTKREALEREGSAELGGGGRFDMEHAADRRNMPGQFDYGPQRVCWMAQIVTDWIGDHGTLKRMLNQIRHPNVVGDSNWVNGEVAKTYVEGDRHLADIDVWVENQAGLQTAMSLVTVELPSRETDAG